MTTANKITVGRILLIPVFIYLLLQHREHGEDWQRWAALGCFALAAVLDGVDGFVARRFHQISELGTILDPLADKLLLVSAIILLSKDHSPWLGQMPLWLTGTILGRDAVLLLGTGLIHFMVGKVQVKPRMSGKVATVFQMATVLWLLLGWDKSQGQGAHWCAICAVTAAICTGVSGMLYVWDGVRQLSLHPSSSPKANKH